MAAKKKPEEQMPEVGAPLVGAQEVGRPAPPITDYVVVVNLTKGQKSFTLLSARAIQCGPKLAGKQMHRSKPVLRKFIPPHLYELQRQGIIALETPREEEMAR